MADLHKFTVQESLNASQGHSGKWDTSQGNQTVDSSSRNIDLSSQAHILILQSTVDMYIRFSATADTLSSTRDLKVLADTIFSITIPRGIGDSIKFCWSRVSSDGTLKIIEV